MRLIDLNRGLATMAENRSRAVAKAITYDRQAAFRKVWMVTLVSGLMMSAIVAVLLVQNS